MALIAFLVLSLMLFDVSIASVIAPKVVKMPIKHRRGHFADTGYAKRDVFNTTLQNYLPAVGYYITVGIGTPPQVVELVISTGSGDTWVFTVGTCANNQAPCLGGSFSQDQSSTFNLLHGLGSFKQKYADGSTIQGPYFSDTLVVGSMAVKNLTMGLGTFSSGIIREGIFGIGLDSNEARVSLGHKTGYANFGDAVKQQNLTTTNCFSMYLENIAAPSGNIIFGGYDLEKFYEPLVMLPIQNDAKSREKSSFTVSLTNFGVSLSGDTVMYSSTYDPYPIPVVIDAGSTLSYLPDEFIQPFITKFGLKRHGDYYFADCGVPDNLGPGSVVFEFGGTGGPTISVPLEEMILPIYDPSTGQKSSYCAFAFGPLQSTDVPTLGQPFMRAVYVLFDLDAFQVGIAQAKFDVVSSRIVEYNSSNTEQEGLTTASSVPPPMTVNYSAKSYAKDIPSTVAAETTNTFLTVPYPTGTTPPQNLGLTLTTGPGAASAAVSNPNSGTSSKTAAAGAAGGGNSSDGNGGNSHLGVEIGVPVGVVGALLIAGFAFLFWRRRGKSANSTEKVPEKQMPSELSPAPAYASPEDANTPVAYRAVELGSAERKGELDGEHPVQELPNGSNEPMRHELGSP